MASNLGVYVTLRSLFTRRVSPNLRSIFVAFRENVWEPLKLGLISGYVSPSFQNFA